MHESVTYRSLTKFLQTLGFEVKTIQGSHVTLFNITSKTTILLALHEPDDLLTSFDLARVTRLLLGKGLATMEQLDRLILAQQDDSPWLVQIEEWWMEGQQWVQQRVVESLVKLTRFVPKVDLPDFKTATGETEIRPITGGSVVFEYHSLHDGAAESLRLELRLFAKPSPSETKLQATLYEDDVPATPRGQELVVLSSEREGQAYRLQLGYGGAFVPCDESPDPYEGGIKAKSSYTLILRVPFESGITELRIPNMVFAPYISAFCKSKEGE